MHCLLSRQCGKGMNDNRKDVNEPKASQVRLVVLSDFALVPANRDFEIGYIEYRLQQPSYG